MFTTFDKALAAFFGSIISMLTLLGFTVPDFFSSPMWEQIMSVFLPSVIPFILTYISKNKSA